MQYKTIVLELLQQRPEMHDQLRKDRKVLLTMEHYARELKRTTKPGRNSSAQMRPGSDPSQIATRGAGDGSQGTGGSFALRSRAERAGSTVPRRGYGVHPPSHVARLKSSRRQRRCLTPFLSNPSAAEPNRRHRRRRRLRPPPHPLRPNRSIPTASTPPSEHPAPIVAIASGEKAKARDILAAIRTLKTIEQEQRPATAEEKQTLARFAGFGPVALSIFPDPVTGRYKDAGWQALGEELKTLLTPEEYDSAKRTTFNAFYTSPTVIAAMHEAIARLGVPGNATILEPGCGIGNFMSQGTGRDALHRRRAGFHLRPHRQALHPDQDIRIENFRDTKLPEDRIDAVIGNVPFADVKLDYHGQKFSLHDYFFAKSIDALKPGGVLALVTTHFTLDKQNAAIREYLASKADFVGAIRLPSDAFKREGTAVVTDIVFLRKRAPGEPAHHADPDWLGVAPLAIDGRRSRQPLLPEPSGNGPGQLDPQGHALRAKATASPATATWPGSSRQAIRPPAGIRPASGIPGRRTSLPRPSRRRRRSATSPKAASSSATTAPSARSHGRPRPCPSSMAARP